MALASKTIVSSGASDGSDRLWLQMRSVIDINPLRLLQLLQCISLLGLHKCPTHFLQRQATLQIWAVDTCESVEPVIRSLVRIPPTT